MKFVCWLFLCAAAFAQVTPTQIRSVTVLPATCRPGTGSIPTDVVTLVAGGGSYLEVCSSTNTWTVVSAAGGLPNGVIPFANATTVPYFPNYNTGNLITGCWDTTNSSSWLQIIPEANMNPLTYEITYTFASPATGFCVTNGSGGGAAGGNVFLASNNIFTGANSIAILNGNFNPTVCSAASPPSWCAGSDFGAWVNAGFANCSANCIAIIPPGTYTYTTTIIMTKPGQSMTGAGSYATILNYTGSTDGIYWQMNPFTIAKAGALRGLTLVGTSSAQNCIHSGSLQGSTWDDLMVAGCTGTNANGILLENALLGTAAWTERTYMHNIHLGQLPEGTPGNTNGLHMLVNGGTFSYSYSDINVWFNVEANQIGMLVDTGAQPYHSDIKLKGNIDNGPSSLLTVAGNLWAGTISVLGESAGTPSPNLIHVTSTGMVNENGTAQVWSESSPGIIAIPQVDTGGFYVLSPYADFSFPSVDTGVSPLPYVRPLVETGAQLISANGTYVVAEAYNGDFEGQLILESPNGSISTTRNAVMIIDVACGQYESSACSLSVPVNYSFDGVPIFINPQVKLTSGTPAAPQLVITVENLVQPQYFTATWYGAPGNFASQGTPNLWPGTSVGPTTPKTIGTVSDYQGNQTITGPSLVLNGTFGTTVNGGNPLSYATQGNFLTWNFSGGQGEADFFNPFNLGTGTGTAFNWYGNNGGSPNLLMSLLANGTIKMGGGSSTGASLINVAAITYAPTTFSTLPTCTTSIKGGTALVTDSTTTTYNATITGSGSNTVIALCNGTNWTAH